MAVSPTAVTKQPMQWMEVPGAIPGCPPGLEYLTQLDQLLVQQQVELLEAFTGIETKNKYAVKNSMGQQVYFAYEESDFCSRICCGAHRGFQFHVTDNNGQEVMRLNREFKCCAGGQWCASCCDCCAYEILVEAPVGQVVGIVSQKGSFWKPHYHIMNERREMVFDMWGPCCAWSGACCTCDVDFVAYGSDGHTEVGKVSRQYAGFAKEMFTDATNFSVTFPQDLDVKLKATMLGACLLVDFMYYEDQDKENNHG
ncbi:phospholipid scramblase 1-like isoform X1 [Branchiostoma lanceolatum]|uniref:Phospholipid scramblase n=2 Tax=Branchiostoma lanceolatum TaxID=7740 RepID=A0A8K0EL07_BRALA|nr:PLSCR1 [Branchiostoma lanceolatum]